MDYVIVQSAITGEKNWSGKGFSDLPAKIYNSFMEAADAVNHYYVNSEVICGTPVDDRQINFVPLSEEHKDAYLKMGLIRW